MDVPRSIRVRADLDKKEIILFHYIAAFARQLRPGNRSYDQYFEHTYALLCRPYSCIRKQTLMVITENIKQLNGNTP